MCLEDKPRLGILHTSALGLLNRRQQGLRFCVSNSETTILHSFIGVESDALINESNGSFSYANVTKGEDLL